MHKLENRARIVTDGAQGIGRAIVTSFHAQGTNSVNREVDRDHLAARHPSPRKRSFEKSGCTPLPLCAARRRHLPSQAVPHILVRPLEAQRRDTDMARRDGLRLGAGMVRLS